MTKNMSSLFTGKTNAWAICFCFCLIAHFSSADINISTKDVTCHGKKDGEATITVTGATGNFEYSITGKPAQGSNKFTGLAGGTYTATVRDKDTDCKYSKTFEIKEPAKLTISATGGGTFQFCNNQSPPTVTLTATASGGTAPVTVSPPSLTVSSSGTFTFKATDKNGCTATATVQVTMVPIVCSRDPNDIIGPEGVGPEKWVAKSASQPYTIRFENDPDFATAPAQEVRINQKLDTHLNLYSLRLGDFGFGSFTFSVPANKTYYSARVDVKDSLGVLVDVTAGIDVTKGEAFWVFRSVDPATGLQPSDASLGFLLVNDSLRRGEGFVSYTVKAANNTVTGDSIQAIASIVFDVNEAIVTPEIFNTIDASPPASNVNPVPAEIQGDYTFTVSASDDGSGAESYDLYLSENNSDFKLLASHISIDSGYIFQGAEGSHYAMYSIARDRVGNLESLITFGDVSFNVPQRAFVKLLTPSGGEEYCVGDTINIKWESTHVDQIDLYYSADNGTSYSPIATEITTADSTYRWALPLQLTGGDSYKILIQASQDSSLHHILDGTLSINKATTPLIISSAGPNICHGDSTVLSVSPNNFKTYQWSNGATTPAITTTLQGTYNVLVIDYNGCSGSALMAIAAHPPVNQPVISASGPTSFCAGDSVALSASEGFEGYLWSTGDTTRSITVYNSGDYSAAGIIQGCRSTPSEIVPVSVLSLPPTPFIEADGPLTICEGDSVGLSASTEASTAFDKYLWSTGDSTRSIAASETGTYIVSAITAEGCTSAPSPGVYVSVLPRPAKPTIQANGPLAFCAGESVVLSAPAGLDNYLWSTGDTTQTITVLNSGNYSVAVRMDNGCTSEISDAVTVNVLETLPKPVIAASGPLSFCQGGTVTLSVPAGFNAYLWSTGDTTQTITVSSAGSYAVTVSMSPECASEISDEVTVTVLAAVPKPIIEASGPLTFCTGQSVTLSAPNGYAGYIWSSGDSTRVITVTTAGSYSVAVISDQGCTSPFSDATNVIVNTAAPKPVIQVSGPLSFCEGGSVTLSAGEGYNAYLWSTGDTTKTITVSHSGNYAVSASITKACISPVSDPAIVQVNPIPPKPIVQANGPLTFCPGGSVMLSAPSGYKAYLWSTGNTLQSITVATTSDVHVTVTDLYDCQNTSDAISIVAGDTIPPVLTLPGDMAVSADAGSCGAVVSIPVPAVSDNCEMSQLTNDYTHTGDASGNFPVGTTLITWTLTDGTGNTTVDTMRVTVTDDRIPEITVVAAISQRTGPASCTASVVISPPVVSDNCEVATVTNSYNHSSNASGVYPSGTTVVIWKVTDTFGNTAYDSTVVTVIDEELPKIIAPASITVNANAASCSANVTLPLPVASDNCAIASITNDRTHSPDASGVYSVGTTTINWTVTDNSGNIATATTSVTVIDNVPPQLINCPADITLTSASNCSAVVTWTPPVAQDACGITSLTSNYKPSDIFAVGTTAVTYTAVDKNGNITTCSFNVTVKPAPLTVLLNARIYACGFNVSCNGATDGSVTAEVSGGCAPYTYAWSDGQTGPVATFGAGNYSVSVTDGKGIKQTVAIRLTQPESLSSTIQISNSIKCYGATDGTAVALAHGGCAPYRYLWSNGQTTQKATGLSAGKHTVTITDANDCSIKNTVTFTQPARLTVNAGENKKVYYGYTPAECTTLSVARVSGGIPGYSYRWSTGETAAQIHVCPTVDTEYTVTVIDQNGCTATDAVKVCVEDVTCKSGKKSEGVKICMRHPLLPKRKVMLCIKEWNVRHFLERGATLGWSCGADQGCEEDDPGVRKIVADDEVIEKRDLFMEVYPNPFSRSTFITMYAPDANKASLKVYSVEGDEVAELFNGELEGMELREFEFTPKHEIPSGIYFVRLTTDNGKVVTKKLIYAGAGK